MEKTKKSSWHGPKQIGIMIYSGLLLLSASCIIGGSTNTILPAISEMYGWDVNFLRSMAGVGCMVLVVGTYVFGLFVQKRGAKLSIGISLIVTAILTAVYGWTQNLAVFIAVIMLLGFFAGGYQTAGCNTLVNNWWPTKKGIVLGWVTMGIVLMDVIWAPFIPKAFAKFGIGWTYTGVAVIVLILALIGLFGIKNLPEEAGEYADGDDSNPEQLKAIVEEMRAYKSPFTVGKMLSMKNTWAMSIGLGLLYMIGMSYVAGIVPRLLGCGYEYSFATTVLIVAGIFGLIGSWVFGFIDQKIGTKKASLVYCIVTLIAFIVALFHAKSVATVWISSIVFFAAQGGCCNLIPSFIGTRYGRWDYPAAYKVIGAITQLMAGLGIMMTGFFGGNTQLMFYFDIGFAVIAFIILIKTDDKLIGKAG